MDNMEELSELLTAILRFVIIYFLMWYIYTSVINHINEAGFFKGVSRGLATLLLTLFCYFLLLLSKGMQAIKYAGDLWRQIGQMKNQLYDLQERVKLLETQKYGDVD